MSWGDAVKEAFDPARRRLGLTGTPFRSDANPIPFVTYADEPGGGKRSASDYVYGYGPALEDSVVRPVIFLAYSGEMRWRTRAGDEITATLGTPMTKDQIAQAWRTALDPAGEWVSRVLEAADKRLTEVRRGMPDAGGLVIAGDHEDARAYAAPAARADRQASRGGAVRRQGREQEDLLLRHLGRPLDGRGADGLRGRGHPAAGRRRVRDQRVHRPVLRPGGRPVRPGPAAGGDRVGVPPVGARAAVLRRRTRGRTRPRTPLSPPPRRPRTRSRSPRRSGSAIPRTRLSSRPSSLSTRPRTSTGCCMTAGSSAPPRRPARRRKRTSSALPGLLNRTRFRTLLRKRQDAQVAARSRPHPDLRPRRRHALAPRQSHQPTVPQPHRPLPPRLR